MLVNSLEKTGSRDALERFSLAIEKLGPILAAILLIPSALALFVLGLAGGYRLASEDQSVVFTFARYLLMVVPVLAVVGPLFLPAADRTNPIRLLLLPIPRSTLYVAQSAAALGDPWNLLLLCLLAGIPAGLAARGALLPALVSLIAAVLLLAVVLALSALATSIVHLVVRDRRRGELAALVFIIVIPVVSMLPALIGDDGRRGDRARAPLIPAPVAEAGRQAFAAYPTELFVRGTRGAAGGDARAAIIALGGLSALVLLLHGAGVVAFRRVLDSPGSTGGRRAGPMRPAWSWRLPGLSPGASAVALAQLRLALRTPRGRSIFLSPLAMFLIFAVMMYRGGGGMDFGPYKFASGLGLATFTAFICMLSILPIAMNQFAVDRAGLTMTLLSPLEDGELLAGKAAGNALVIAPPALASMVAALLLFPGGSPYSWMALPLGLLASYLLVAPIAAIASATFPRSVDMNSIGRGSNAHGAAGFIGLIAFAIAGVIPLALALVATRVLDRPYLAPVLLAGWCLAAGVIAKLLFIPARRIFATRRENLAMIR
jgi:hypothetical protein